VWLGLFLAATMTSFARVCDRRGDAMEAAQWRKRAGSLGASIDRTAWDGAWYQRAFYDDGTPVGTARAPTCRIDSIAQSWAILSRAVDPARAAQALRSADEMLVKEQDRVILVLDPSFEGSHHNPGYIKAYPSGVRENGGQYTHAATWLGFAHAQVGDGARAERIFRLLNPILYGPSTAEADRYRVEPYALAGDVYGVAPLVGRGGWTWYTGSAAWMWRLGVEAILGLRMEGGGLRVDPCIPPSWPGFEATVRIGEHDCHVVVDNSSGTGRDVQSVTLDGVAVDSALVRLGAGAVMRRELRVVLGAAAKAAE
jgi:cyclic beta-1,2-glucan synthetase